MEIVCAAAISSMLLEPWLTSDRGGNCFLSLELCYIFMLFEQMIVSDKPVSLVRVFAVSKVITRFVDCFFKSNEMSGMPLATSESAPLF